MCTVKRSYITFFQKSKKHLQKTVDNGRKMFAYLIIQKFLPKNLSNEVYELIKIALLQTLQQLTFKLNFSFVPKFESIVKK